MMPSLAAQEYRDGAECVTWEGLGGASAPPPPFHANWHYR